MRAVPNATDLPVLLPPAAPLTARPDGDVLAGFTARIFTPKVLPASPWR